MIETLVKKTGSMVEKENIVNIQIGALPNPPPLPLPAVQQQQGDGQQLGGQAQGELLQTRVRPVIPVPENGGGC